MFAEQSQVQQYVNEIADCSGGLSNTWECTMDSSWRAECQYLYISTGCRGQWAAATQVIRDCTQSSLRYAGAVQTIETSASRMILNFIRSAIRSQCRISLIYCNRCEYFGFVAMAWLTKWGQNRVGATRTLAGPQASNCSNPRASWTMSGWGSLQSSMTDFAIWCKW